MKDQYNVDTTGNVAVTPPEKVSINTAEQRKIAMARQSISALFRIEPMLPDFLQPVLATKPLVRIDCLKKTVYVS